MHVMICFVISKFLCDINNNLNEGRQILQKIVICLNVCRLLQMGVSWPLYTASVVSCCREEFVEASWWRRFVCLHVGE
jgi:hypothetical protein